MTIDIAEEIRQNVSENSINLGRDLLDLIINNSDETNIDNIWDIIIETLREEEVVNLNMSNLNLSVEELNSILGKIFEKNLPIRELNISGNNIDLESSQHLNNLIQNRNLTRLIIDNMNSVKVVSTIINNLLTQETNLNYLSFAGNRLPEAAGQLLLSNLSEQNSRLELIGIRNNLFSRQLADDIANRRVEFLVEPNDFVTNTVAKNTNEYYDAKIR